MSEQRTTTDRRGQATGLAMRGLTGLKHAVAGAGKRIGGLVRRPKDPPVS